MADATMRRRRQHQTVDQYQIAGNVDKAVNVTVGLSQHDSAFSGSRGDHPIHVIRLSGIFRGVIC
jgi:hypothetical protein